MAFINRREDEAKWALNLYLGRRPRLVLYELCSGTAILGKLAKGGSEGGGHPLIHEVVTVDINPNRRATMTVDLSTPEGREQVAAAMSRHVEAGYIIVAHASPPCTEYSKAKTIGIRDLDTSNKFVRGVIDLMDRYAMAWTLENPGTDHEHNLWQQTGFPELHPHALVDYCAYGHAIQKRTGIAMSSQHMLDTFPTRICNGNCPASVQVTPGGRTRHLGHFSLLNGDDRIALPAALCAYLIKALVAEAVRMHRVYLTRFGKTLLDTGCFHIRAIIGKRDENGVKMRRVQFVGFAEPVWIPKSSIDAAKLVASKLSPAQPRPRPSYAVAFE
jgi:hypothetical protein